MPAATSTGAPPPKTSPRPGSCCRCGGHTASSSACWAPILPRSPTWPNAVPRCCCRGARRAARRTGHLRPQSCHLDRRAVPPHRAAARLRAARVRRHARRRRRHTGLARRGRRRGAGADGGAARSRADDDPVPHAWRPPGGVRHAAGAAGGYLQQDRARAVRADEAGVRRGRRAGAAGNGRQQHDAPEAQPKAGPGYSRRRGRAAGTGTARPGGDADRSTRRIAPPA